MIIRVSSVSIEADFCLDGRGSIPGKERFSRLHRVQTGSGTHHASYPMGTEGSFPLD
jgi:hypothetical protein